MSACSVDGCGSHCKARGLCSKHYQRWARDKSGPLGLLVAPPPPKLRGSSIIEKLELNSSWVDGCREWQGGRIPQGYGSLKVAGTRYGVHRLALELKLGRPIRAGLCALHSCDNPPCCNPAHLREGTYADNAADMVARGRAGGPKGEAVWVASLSNEQALAVYGHREGSRPARDIAVDFGVSLETVRRIWRGSRWGWLTGHN